MPLTRTTLRELLDRHGLGPSRALGQNFLCDPNMVAKIVRLAGVQPGDHVVEVGPGLGSLTEGLCEAGANVTAIEIDRYLLPALADSVGDYAITGQLRVVHADVREVSWDDLLAPADADAVVDEWKLVANLPYNIATPLVLDLLAAEPRFARFLVMMQREAGERLAAGPGSKTYGIPSVLTAYWGTATLVASVGAELFLPKPNVESVLVRIDRHADQAPRPDGEFKALSKVVRTGFGQRRKMLRRSLANLIEAEGFELAEVAPTARPEDLDLAAWLRLSRVASGA